MLLERLRPLGRVEQAPAEAGPELVVVVSLEQRLDGLLADDEEVADPPVGA